MRAFMMSMKADIRYRLGELAHPVFLPQPSSLPIVDTASLEQLRKSQLAASSSNTNARMVVTLYALGMALRGVAAPPPELEGLPSPKAEQKKKAVKSSTGDAEYWDIAKVVLVHTQLLDNLRLEARSHTELPVNAPGTLITHTFISKSYLVSNGNVRGRCHTSIK
jgi:hypothetical protein